jgi:hypothetical protein
MERYGNMEEQDIKINEDLKQKIIDVLTKNGGEIDQEYKNIFNDNSYFKDSINFKYDVLKNDGTDRLIVAFREDSEFAFIYDFRQVFIDFHYDFGKEENIKNNENNDQLDTNDTIANDSFNEHKVLDEAIQTMEKLIKCAENINKKGTLPQISIDSELNYIVVYNIWILEEDEEIETVCQTMIKEIAETCVDFFVQSLPVTGINIKSEIEN